MTTIQLNQTPCTYAEAVQIAISLGYTESANIQELGTPANDGTDNYVGTGLFVVYE